MTENHVRPAANAAPGRRPETLAAILTTALLIFLAVLFTLLQLVVLNGAGERQGLTAMGISLGCQSIVILGLSALAARAAGFLTARLEWDGVLAVVVAVTAATMIGGTLSFLAMILSIPVAGIR